jgi:hypothetical protein
MKREHNQAHSGEHVLKISHSKNLRVPSCFYPYYADLKQSKEQNMMVLEKTHFDAFLMAGVVSCNNTAG